MVVDRPGRLHQLYATIDNFGQIDRRRKHITQRSQSIGAPDDTMGISIVSTVYCVHCLYSYLMLSLSIEHPSASEKQLLPRATACRSVNQPASYRYVAHIDNLQDSITTNLARLYQMKIDCNAFPV